MSGEYVLTASLFFQVTATDELGRPLKTAKRVRGDIITGLDADDVDRLLTAGAIAEVSAAVPAAEPVADQGVDPVVDPALEGPQRPNKTAPVKAWEDYVVALHEASEGKKGLNRADAEKSTKPELIELFG